MSRKRCGPYSLGVISLLMISIMTPAFAEVTNLETNSYLFYAGEQIKFSGKVEKGSNGLVTIVIRDENNEFVMLSQAIIQSDNTYKKTIKINEKFTKHGVYNATSFILNMTKGVTTNFGISLNGVPIDFNTQETINESPTSVLNDKIINEETTIDEDNVQEDNVQEDNVQEDNVQEKSTSHDKTIPGFVDSNKDPKYYVDRYYNEPKYASWFDRNYPELTIESAVGYAGESNEPHPTVEKIINNEIIPEVQASTIVESIQKENDNSEIAQMTLAIAGLGILFGGVFGVKKKADNNSKQISINRETIRKKIIHPIIGSSPKEILQTRLAKGDISLEEYEKLILKFN